MDGSNIPSRGPARQPAPVASPDAEYRPVEPASSPTAARPRILTRFLMALAGGDCELAARCPANEWRLMSLDGAGLLAGAAFTAACVWVALGELFGGALPIEGRAVAATLGMTVRFIVDRKFVAADWYAQGLSYAWSHGLIDRPGLSARLSRFLGVVGRIAYSLAFSSLIAMVLMTIVFRDATHRKLVQENLQETRPC